MNKHWCVVSSPYVDSSKQSDSKFDTYLGNVDSNNLYGNALQYPVCTGYYRYLDLGEYSNINWLTVTTDGDIGYFVVCDLHYPPEIHRNPECKKPDNYKGTRKLVASCTDK